MTLDHTFSKSWINPDGVPEIGADQLQEKISEVVMIDVRRPDEFVGELGHIEGAKLITLETEFETEAPKLDKSQTYVFICRSGARSSRATAFAQELGLQKVFNLQGGMLKWNALGLPVKKWAAK